MQSAIKPNGDEQAEESMRIPVWAFLIAVIAYGVWVSYSLETLMEWLWGPYARVLSDAGPPLLSRGGVMVALGLSAPFLLLAYMSWCERKLSMGIIFVTIALTSIPAYGYYLHHIVALQGVEESMLSLKAEVGFNEEWPVPEHIAPALQLSHDLAKTGKAPWLPRAWTAVTWPEFTTSSK